MQKQYIKIRLEMSEGTNFGSTEYRSRWVESVKQLPAQEVPGKDGIGYNKHYYEIMLANGTILKFRVDVTYDRLISQFVTEENVDAYITDYINSITHG